MSNTYYIALVKGYGHRNYWRNGHADSTVIVQCRRSRDYLSPDTWQYMGEHITTKARLRENKTALLTEINRKFNTSFTHVVID